MKTKNGWEYNSYRTKEGFKFNIQSPRENKKTPTELYKIYALNQFSFDSLLNSYIYATHPCQFNDLFDCHEEIIKYDDIDIIKNFLKANYDSETINYALEKRFWQILPYMFKGI